MEFDKVSEVQYFDNDSYGERDSNLLVIGAKYNNRPIHAIKVVHPENRASMIVIEHGDEYETVIPDARIVDYLRFHD